MAIRAHKSLMLYSACLVLILSADSAVAWSVSTIIGIASDILETSDDRSLDSMSSDPLVDSIDQHRSGGKKGPNFDFDGGGGHNERFLVPMLSTSVGDNNQLMEYMTAAVIAKATQRTLCLTPFFNGPVKHSGKHGGSLTVYNRYDVSKLSQFVKVSSLDSCFQRCNRHIHGEWWLRHSSASNLGRGWTRSSNVRTHDFGRQFAKWASIDEVKRTAEELNFGNEMCVALGGLFPGLRWRGAYLAPSLYMRPSQTIMNLANSLQNLAFGQERKFLAVHWRFEESLCNKKEIGTCFLRCGDGSVISSGLRAKTRGLPDAERRQKENAGTSCKHMQDSSRVVVRKEDLISAIADKAVKENVSAVYIATDGWMRGSHGQNLIREVVKQLRTRRLSVSGLWRIGDLPNIISKTGELLYNDEVLRLLSRTPLARHSLSIIEQELCFRATSFMGSGESTWSLAVFRARLASRRWNQLMQAGEAGFERADVVVEQLLQDSHAAGLQCRYRSLYRSTINATEESYQDEAPDTWLDMEACEGRLGRGGSCSLFECFF